MIKAELDYNLQKKENKTLYSDNEVVQRYHVLRLITGIRITDLISVSSKIMGIMSSVLTREEWKRIVKEEDLSKIGILITENLVYKGCDQFAAAKDKIRTEQIEDPVEPFSIDESLKELQEAYRKKASAMQE